MSGELFKCPSPVALTDTRLKQVKSWIAAIPAGRPIGRSG